jgi:glycosyltransferase involved in cell wall biosynthesis
MIFISITRTLDQFQNTLKYARSVQNRCAKYTIVPPAELTEESLNEFLRASGNVSVQLLEGDLQQNLYKIFGEIPLGEWITLMPEGWTASEEFLSREASEEFFFCEEEGGAYGGVFKSGTFCPAGKREVDWVNMRGLKFEHLDFYSLFKRLESQKKAALPRILAFGAENLSLKTLARAHESEELEVFSYPTSKNAVKLIAELDPDVVLTLGESYELYPELVSLPPWLKSRWIHDWNVKAETGEMCYNHAIRVMVEPEKNYPLISIISPVRNTGEKLRDTFESVKAQTWWNWEWVLVNDGEDELTDKICKELASNEPRIKYYDISPRSNCRVGEAKYRGFSLANGDYLVELDHDDLLVPEAIELVALSFEKYPDAGFCYSNYAEVDASFNDLSYGGNDFAYGYGLYSQFGHNGRQHTEQHTPHINPVSIRSNVAMPNHLRAWSREAYFKCGGHSRRLSIMDDLDILIRTFLTTKMVKIDWMCYWQFYLGLFYDSTSTFTNTQNLVRADIQRRARSISSHYNLRIKARFEEMGIRDWAYEQNPDDPRYITPLKGEQEGRACYLLDRESIERRLYFRGIKSVYQS